MALLQIAEPGMSPAPHEHRRAIGIDLGTTNSLVATVRHSLPEVLGDAQGRVLLPSIVKDHFPDRVGTVTGLYSVALNIGATTAAAATVPITDAFGDDWRLGLACWSLAALVALPPWLLMARSGPVYLAGEHLSDAWPGFMNGAAQTGRLAAQAILAEG